MKALLIFWNWTYKNIPDCQHSARFRKSTKSALSLHPTVYLCCSRLLIFLNLLPRGRGPHQQLLIYSLQNLLKTLGPHCGKFIKRLIWRIDGWVKRRRGGGNKNWESLLNFTKFVCALYNRAQNWWNLATMAV